MTTTEYEPLMREMDFGPLCEAMYAISGALRAWHHAQSTGNPGWNQSVKEELIVASRALGRMNPSPPKPPCELCGCTTPSACVNARGIYLCCGNPFPETEK